MKKQRFTSNSNSQIGMFSIGLLILSILLSGCGSDDKGTDIRAYYFPLETLDSGLVYEYQSARNDSLAPEYWYHLRVKQKDETLFLSNYYNYRLEVEQLSVEQVVASGSLLKEYKFYELDSTGLQKATDVQIIHPNVFPFVVKDSTVVYLFNIEWPDSQNPDWSTNLTRNRRYMGETTYTYQGKSIPAIKFLVNDLVETKQEGYQEVRISGYELYAKGIGLVYYEKLIGTDGPSFAYELADRYPMKQLEEQYSKLNPN